MDAPKVIDKTDLPETGTPEHEIEVTPEMIEAGVEAYRPFWCEVRDCDEGAPERMVAEVFMAMARVSQR